MIFSLLRYEIKEPQGLIEVLVYEASRIFKDRLVDKESKAKFDSILYNLLKTNLKYNDKLIDTYFISKVGNNGEKIIPNLPSLGRIGKADFISLVEQAMRAYEREFKEMNIHLFDEILDLIAYTERALSKPGGHVLMAGRPGVGRRTAT
jgi:dynein heavy chain 2